MKNRKDATPQTVSLIIPALNEELMLKRLLDSIRNLDQPPRACIHEIIIVDAASTDATVDLALANNCTVIHSSPGHVSISRNLGAKQASGSILAFIDADCELPKNWLNVISNELQHDNVVAAGSSMASSSLNTTWVERAWFELAHKRTSEKHSSQVDWLATFNIAVKNEAFELVGGFDESLMTCEDVEFGYRLSSIGTLKRIDVCGVIHHGESKTLKEFFHREAWRARGALGILAKHWKNPRELASFLLPPAIVCGVIFSLLLLLIYPALGGSSSTGLLIASTTGILPIALLTLRRKVKRQMFIPCGLLMYIYFFARVQGTLRPFRRVERT